MAVETTVNENDDLLDDKDELKRKDQKMDGSLTNEDNKKVNYE